MFQLLAIKLSLGSIGWAFFSPLWAWSPLVTSAALLLFTLFGVKQKKWRYVEELSPSANEMLQKFGHYYSMPFAGRDFSGAASTIQFAAVAVGVIGAFKGFYWGLGVAVAFWFVLGPVKQRGKMARESGKQRRKLSTPICVMIRYFAGETLGVIYGFYCRNQKASFYKR